MIPKLTFTAKSWPEENQKEAERIFGETIPLNGNKDILCYRIDPSGVMFAYEGYEDHFPYMEKYGYADTEEAIEKYLKPYIEDPEKEYFIELGLMSKDYDKYYKNGYYINENGEDTGIDFYDIYEDEESEPETEYENAWVTFVIYELKLKNNE